jgi:hypothetical protein
MSDYHPQRVPQEYDPVWMEKELYEIANALGYIARGRIRLVPVHVAPVKPREGDVVNADGTDWNPGAGPGVYEFLSGSWNKL